MDMNKLKYIRKYYCKKCDSIFTVFHQTEDTNKRCGWCGKKLKLIKTFLPDQKEEERK